MNNQLLGKHTTKKGLEFSFELQDFSESFQIIAKHGETVAGKYIGLCIDLPEPTVRSAISVEEDFRGQGLSSALFSYMRRELERRNRKHKVTILPEYSEKIQDGRLLINKLLDNGYSCSGTFLGGTNGNVKTGFIFEKQY